MPYSLGPNITRTGLVFAYDTGDQTNSYKGEPITNQFSVQGSSGFGSGADNAVNFPIQGTVGFVRLGFGQTFGGYTIQSNDVVYKYPLNSSIGGCHYHGMTAAIPAGAYATFTFDYYISPDTDLSTGNSTFLANFENYGGGALGGGVSMPNNAKGVWQTVTFTSGPAGAGTQAMFLYPGGCGGNIATNGYILYRNPQVVWLNYTVPFVQGTRSTTQGLLDISGNNNTITLANMTYGANNALSFDGTDDYLQTTGYTAHQSNQGTIEVVAKPDIVSGDRYPIGIGGTGTYGASRAIRINSAYWSAVTYGSSNEDYDGIALATVGSWYHVVFGWYGTTIYFYVNGVAYQATRSGLVTPQGTTLRVGNPPWGIGSSWSGLVPIAKHYNTLLSTQQVLQNYNSYKTRFNLS